jgi:RHS repeat-associated protein
MKHAAVALLLALTAGLSMTPTATFAAQPGPVFVPRGPNEPVVNLPLTFPAPMPRLSSNSAHIDPPPATITQPATQPPPPPKPPPAVTKDAFGSTAHVTTYADGTGRVDFYGDPSFHNTSQGWVSIDTTIKDATSAGVSDPTVAYAAEGAIRPVRFGNASNDLVQLVLDGGPIVVSASSLTVSQPVIASGAVLYTNVATSTDLRYQVGLGGVKEEIILNGSTAPHQFTFHYSDPTGQLGKATLQPDGSYRFDARIDSTVAIGLAPVVAFEQGKATPAALHDPTSASLSLVKAGDGFDVTVAVNTTWLQGKTYPIVLDPTLTFSDTNGLMSAYTDYNTTNGPGTNTPQTGNDLWTGTFTYPNPTNPTVDYNPSRTFIGFNLSSIPAGSLITYATLNMNVSGCVALGSTCSVQSSYNLDLHRMTGTWNWNSTWNQLSALTASGAFASISESGSRIAAASSSSTFWETWEVSQQVQRWINGASNGGDTNYGFEVQIRNEQRNIGGPYWCYQRTTYCVNQSNHPYLSVAYAAPTSVVGDQSATVNWSFSGQPSYATGYPITSFDTTLNTAGPGMTAPGSAVAGTLTGLTNTHTYNLSMTGNFAWTGTGTNPGPAYVSAGTVTLPLAIASSVGFGGGQASVGQQVTYSLVASNGTASPLAVTSITDTLQAAFQVSGAPVQMDGSPCTSPTCSISNGTLTIGSFTLAANSSHTFSYTGLELGTPRGCAAVTNGVSAIDANGTSHASSPLLVCDGGLGISAWWSYVQQTFGPGANGSVNVADGNLVVSQVDSTPIQAHGQLKFELKRVYNSQDTGNVNLPISASVGGGWRLMAGVEGPIALYVPGPSTAVSYPTGVLLVDSNGLRSQFQPRGGAFTAVDVTTRGLAGTLAALNPRALPALDSGYTHLCVDTSFAAPIGVHVGLWRYVEVNGTCTSYSGAKVFGFAAMRVDRMRFEFSADGRLLDTSDGAGNELLYAYDGQNRLLTVSEPRCQTPNKCRTFGFSYSSNETDVTDPAGRTTKYMLTGGMLTQVVNPDRTASTINYTYGSANCSGAGPNQLCSVTDPNGGKATFTYTPNYVSGGPARIATIVDRRGYQTTLTYANTASPEYVTSDASDSPRASHRTRFITIDSLGRIAEIDQGDTSNNFLHQAFYTWDITSASCRQPDNVMDNNLCQLVRRATPGTTSSTDESTAFVYNSEGRVIEQAKTISTGVAASTTSGYHAEYFAATSTVNQFNDAVSGNGAVASTGTVRADSQTLFYVSDQTQLLPPRGNVSGGNVAALKTTYVVDNAATASPSNRPTSTVCPTSTTNTGLVCEEDAPWFDSSNTSAVTTYTYDVYGQKITMETPVANALHSGATYAYTYYDDSVTDLSNTVSAGGWLKATTDPLGNFSVQAYDAAGNVTKSWDRNSTTGSALSNYPSGGGLPVTFIQDNYNPSGFGPWRYLLSHRDQLGDLTTYTVDKNGNRLAIRPPRGNVAGNSSYDVTQVFDANDNLTKQTTPAELSTPVNYYYDGLNQQIEKLDQLGKVTVYLYDTASRLTTTEWTRGPWDATTAPAGCRQSWSTDAPLPWGYILCSSSSSYDGTNNVTSTTDGNGQTTTMTYDANHDETSRQIPRNTGSTTTVREDHVYDVEGHVLHVCPPREFSPSEGNASSCTATGYYSTHNAWDNSGRLTTVTSYRTVSGGAMVTSYVYDADGNLLSYTDPNTYVVTSTYDLLDRKLTETHRRDALTTYTISYTYDANGNQTSLTKPVTGGGSPTSQITAFSFDAANRPIDTVQASTSTDATQAGGPDSAGGVNIRTRQSYDADGHVVAQFSPNAFPVGWSYGQAPDARFMTRTDYDLDGRPSAKYMPRFDSSTYSDLGGAFSSTTQTTQCATSLATQVATIAGVPAYPSGVGLCQTQWAYNAKSQVQTLYLPSYNGGNSARKLTYDYTDDGLLLDVRGPDPSVATPPAPVITNLSYLYDGVGNRVKTIDFYGFQSTTSYTGDNIVQQQTSQPAGSNTHQLTYSLDANGNRTLQTDQASQHVQYEYYTDNKLRDWFDAMGNETFYKLDASGNIIGVYQPSINAAPFDANNSGGTPIVIGYTQDDLPYQVIEPVRPDGTLRRVTSYTFDLAGRRIQTQVQLANYNTGGWGGTFSSWNGAASNQFLAYLPDDRISSQTGRDNATISYGYDPGGNVLNATSKNGSGVTTSTSTNTFYLDSLPRTVDDATITSQFAYDATGAVTLKAQVLDGVGSPNTFTHLYTYNDAGKISAVSSSLLPSGQVVNWWYDKNGRVNQENFPRGSQSSGAQASWTWNNDDTLATVAITNSGGQTSGIYSYTYDSTRRVLSQALSNTGTSADGTFSYQYDAASRLTSFVNSNNATYTITWDHDGNRLSYGSQSFTYNADDSIATNGAASYGYNAMGLLSSDGCMSYSYDGFDRLSQVSAIGSCNMTAVNYAYDSFDRQISRSAGSLTTAFHYDGLTQQTVLERTTATADTVYDTGSSGESVAVNQGSLPLTSSGTQYILDDGHNNAAFITNASSTTVCVARFDPWGSPYGSGTTYAQPCTGGAGTINKHFYRGGRLDDSTGYYQLGSRTYAPSKASFLEPDTYRSGTAAMALSVGTDPLTRNRYSYVNGDPVNHYDPSGHYAAQARQSSACDQTCQEQNTAAAAQTAVSNNTSSCDWRCHIANGWRAASQAINIRPDAGGAQDNLIALGNSMDSGWRQRYTDSLSGSSSWIDGTRGDLASGDLRRVARGYAGVLVFSSNFLPGAGKGVAVVEDASRVAVNEVMDHSAQIENFVKDAAESCAVNSFVPGTLVLMADGSKRAIEQLRVGDQVEAEDPEKGVKKAEPVQNVIVGRGLKHLVKLSLDGKVITTTYNHPFWVADERQFQWAADLSAGQHLLLSDGRAPPLQATDRFDEVATVYNLSIKDIHTYFVGSAGMLVHNSCYKSFSEFKSANGPAGEGMQWHHVVEQSQVERSGFDVSRINSSENVMAISKSLNQRLNAFYSTKPPELGVTVRDWLSGQSWGQQFQFGLDAMRDLRGSL